MDRKVPGSIWYAKMKGEDCNALVLQSNPLTVWRCTRVNGVFLYGDHPPQRVDAEQLLAEIGVVDADALERVLRDWKTGKFPKRSE